MSKDYYKILGIDKGASKDEIKKAFRKMAHEHHPDKTGGDDKKFKEVNEAYSVLSNDSKKAQYDQFGSDGPAGFGGGGYSGAGQGGQGFGGFDFSGFTQGGGFGGFGGGADGVEFDLGDIFGSVFGGGGRGGHSSGGRGGRAKTPKGSDVSVDIEISFKDSIFGAEKEFSLHRTAICEHCKGSRAEPKAGTHGHGSHGGGATAQPGDFESCKTCDGQGQIIETRRSMFGAFQSARVCDDCSGTGKIPKTKCSVCRGKGILHNKKDTITVIVPAGIDSGEMLRVTGKGEAVTGGTSGDLYIRIHVRHVSSEKTKDSNMRKEGLNLAMDHTIKLTDSLLGGDTTLETLDGPITIEIPQGITHGEILRVKNKGVPHGAGAGNPTTSRDSSTRRGDLMVHIKINIPSKLSKSARKLIEELKGEGM